MDVRALCVSLMVHLLFLLSAHVQRFVSGSVILRVEPNKMQFFEYEHVTFHCEGFNGSTGLKIIHRSKGILPSCDTSATMKSTVFSCSLPNIYPDDSGEYWCESEESERSNSVTITVAGGSVILEIPALLMEGEALTLHCRNKTTSSNPSAVFYKNGHVINTSPTGEMTIPSVATCDKGHYKCKISGGGESAESRLDVKGKRVETCHSCSSLPIVISVLLALLLLVGLLHLGKDFWRRGFIFLSTLILRPSAAQTVSAQAEVAEVADADTGMYASVAKKRKKQENHDFPSAAVYYTLDDAADAYQPETRVPSRTTITVHSPGAGQPLTQDALYSTVQTVAK